MEENKKRAKEIMGEGYEYNLLSQNCDTFVSDVAKSVNINYHIYTSIPNINYFLNIPNVISNNLYRAIYSSGREMSNTERTNNIRTVSSGGFKQIRKGVYRKTTYSRNSKGQKVRTTRVVYT